MELITKKEIAEITRYIRKQYRVEPDPDAGSVFKRFRIMRNKQAMWDNIDTKPHAKRLMKVLVQDSVGAGLKSVEHVLDLGLDGIVNNIRFSRDMEGIFKK